jgi:hypothetical protein
MTEGFCSFFENFFTKAMPQENALAETQGIPFVMHRLDIERGIRPRDGQAESIGAGVDGGNVNRLGHFRIYRQRCVSAADGVYFVVRIPSCSAIRWRSCLFTVETLASPSSSMKLCLLAMTSNSRLIMV